jgi:hypothetical protein
MTREHVGSFLFLGAVVAAVVLTAVGVSYGWALVPVLGAFVAGALLLADS